MARFSGTEVLTYICKIGTSSYKVVNAFDRDFNDRCAKAMHDKESLDN